MIIRSKVKPQCLLTDLTLAIGLKQLVKANDKEWSGVMRLGGQ